MIDKFLLNFFGWIDDQIQKIEDVWTFDIGQELKKEKKKKKK